MAPTRPLPNKVALPKRSTLRQSQSLRPQADTTSSARLFTENKVDKRRIKHAQFMSKVAKSQAPKQRRRRPNKKLVTTLDSLADALPTDDQLETTSGTRAVPENLQEQVNVIKRQSMKSTRGALKKKQKIDNNERDRFARNMAQMATRNAEANSVATSTSSTNKLRNLRGFIAQTLEKRSDLR